MTDDVFDALDGTSGVTGLDRQLPFPLYVQLKEAFLREIRHRQLKPGDQLPSESQLMHVYGASRATIRQALQELVQEGVVERVQGRGTFVAPNVLTHSPYLTSFTLNMTDQGHSPSRRILDSYFETAPAQIRRRLDMDEQAQAQCWFLKRLLLVDGEPIGVSETWLPQDIADAVICTLKAEDLDLEAVSLYEVLGKPSVGADLLRGVETVHAELSTQDQASMLNCRAGAPILAVNRLTFNRRGRPVEWTSVGFLANRYYYRVEMSSKGAYSILPSLARLSTECLN